MKHHLEINHSNKRIAILMAIENKTVKRRIEFIIGQVI